MQAPVICLTHGGGPMPILGDPAHVNIVQSWQTRVRKLLKLGTPLAPKAIILVTAHWSTKQPTISSGSSHELYYDYYGFPQEAYSVKYNASGSPAIAQEIFNRLKTAGFSPVLDGSRGWDHGVFVPLKMIIPDESIPVVQMSVLDSEDPEEHFKMGQAIADLRKENVAIIGSGFATFHNLRVMFSGTSRTPTFHANMREWSSVLNEAVMTDDAQERIAKLKQWRKFPHAYTMHPNGGAEHFLPLIVSAGAAGSGKGGLYGDDYMGNDMFSFYWE
ncbi:Extradiol ring-cleavage dioxygenase, class III enzyme, subunit B [Talaromyces proteolyticus]|uniref:Extradiol ring-cleavage dioxygenase, class III enzyme, subunit B n=1 Tax=Talaromyces proteolyticus TaxID=1131652 RepID=A0AAD4Q4B8_9EURO|nr:Extradiol ring-cleavage dioxygenase, class III enzyme, subunit B [Talaromyces proteolyticus]KAH8705999.1 Extradiol ring-cleavage dioxygenase, class III enzyme, subunit B [Talaromyces proteolyticus]